MSAERVERHTVYVDNAATTPVLSEVVDRMAANMRDVYGNPSSRHAMGLAAERAIEQARRSVADAIGADRKEIVFTSGGTESNNFALKGAAAARARRGRLIVSQPTEHPSVLEPLDALRKEGFDVASARVDREGRVDFESLAEQLSPETVLVSVMWVNNELGTVQPIGRIARAVRARAPHALLHVDAVQALGKVPIDVRAERIDLLTLSSHKVHGPKGVGALYVRDGVGLRALIDGGGQESGLRSGTENVPGIVGFGEAVRLVTADLSESIDHMRRCKRLLLDRIRSEVPEARVNGPADPDEAAPHIVSVSFPGLRGDVLLSHLEAAGVYVATGSACASRKTVNSHVLAAVGLPPRLADGTIRISLSKLTTEAEVLRVADAVAEAVDELKVLMV